MAKSDNRLKAELPRGFADRSAADIRAMDAMLARIKTVYERYGFEPVETPMIEYTDVLGKFLPDADRPNEGVFSFQDEPSTSGAPDVRRQKSSGVAEVPKDERWLSLRYDLTAPLARYFAENFERLPKPYRSYRAGWVFRNEKPGPGRFRQFMQIDADTIGTASPAADAEMCMMAADAMEALGIEPGQYVIKVSSRKMLDGEMEAIGVADPRQRLTVLRAIDKLDRLGVDGVRALLGAGRKDESGDFTKGAMLGHVQIEHLIGYVTALVRDGDTSARDSVIEVASKTKTGVRGLDELEEMTRHWRAAGFARDRIRIDPSVVRGLEYYTGAVFEAELLFDVPNEKGERVVFGSVGGGGRYDGLVGRFRSEDAPATGFSIGVSRLLAALKALGKIDTAAIAGPVVVLVMDRERIADSQQMVTELRNAGIAAEMYLGSSGMKAQMKYADRRNAPCVVIQGEDERTREGGPFVQIKDLVLGKQLSETVADNVAWREERPGQFEVPSADLVKSIHELLERQSGGPEQ